jgi:hypothetical protein
MPLRDMPAEIHEAVLAAIKEQTGLAAVTQGRSDRDGVLCLPHLDRIEGLCGLVANAACVISTDTAMVHLADAFDVPCLAVFTTHRPEWRVRDYPGCTALHLPVAGFPEALEFARDDADLLAAGAAWRGGAPELQRRLTIFLAALRQPAIQ